ncbi:unnamed protein product [Penicillium salamii]|nr:unnamed protein product [Penicillium salamii]
METLALRRTISTNYHPSMMSSKRIAIVTCSTREPRLNPFITRYVLDIVSREVGSENIDIVDLSQQNLPLYNEPEVPSHLPEDNPTPHYKQQHTQEWSTTVRRYGAFIFVTPQYNWSIPASLKNALDYLFYEWKGKPAAIVTYGGRGGGKAAGHLQQILQGLRMRVIAPTPGLCVKTSWLSGCVEANQISLEDQYNLRESGAEVQISSMYLELLAELQKDEA